MPPITESSLHQDLRPLQAVNNCIGRSEQGAEAEAVGKESQCLRCEVCEPDPPLGSSAYNKLSHLLMFFSQRGLKAAKKAGLEWAGVIAAAIVNPKLCRMTRFGAARARPKPMTLPVEKQGHKVGGSFPHPDALAKGSRFSKTDSSCYKGECFLQSLCTA